MRLNSLQLQQFRSYNSLSLSLGKDVHLFAGHNGAGKTNILEAISLLSLTKSVLGSDDTDMYMWGSEFYRITGECVCDDGEPLTLEVVSQTAPRRAKAFLKNDVKISNGDMVGIFPTVTFLPQDLQLFTGSPSLRRQFLDQLLCQLSPNMLKDLTVYAKTLKQRNSLLKNIAQGKAEKDDLTLWDTALSQLGARITLRRIELLQVLQCTLLEQLHQLGEQWENAELQYIRKTNETSEEAIAAELKQLLERQRDRDCILQATTSGPHREDWSLQCDGRDISQWASRGQQRTAVLALLLLEVSYIQLQRNQRPVVLLDDVFSELDNNHQESLLSSLQGLQVIITTTHMPDNLHGAEVYTVNDGEVVSAPRTASAKASAASSG